MKQEEKKNLDIPSESLLKKATTPTHWILKSHANIIHHLLMRFWQWLLKLKYTHLLLGSILKKDQFGLLLQSLLQPCNELLLSSKEEKCCHKLDPYHISKQPLLKSSCKYHIENIDHKDVTTFVTRTFKEGCTYSSTEIIMLSFVICCINAYHYNGMFTFFLIIVISYMSFYRNPSVFSYMKKNSMLSNIPKRSSVYWFKERLIDDKSEVNTLYFLCFLKIVPVGFDIHAIIIPCYKLHLIISCTQLKVFNTFFPVLGRFLSFSIVLNFSTVQPWISFSERELDPPSAEKYTRALKMHVL